MTRRFAMRLGATRLRDGDQGVSAVLMALSLMVLLGMSAVALDAGNLYQLRRSAQNASDQAALAAAYTECIGGDEADAIQAGEDAALANGFDENDPDITVTITPQGANSYHAEVTTEVDATFAKVLGASQLGTAGEAIVSCTDGSGEALSIFAKATGCGNELKIPTDHVQITGGVHSNGKINITGNRPTIEGGVTYGVPSSPDGGPPNGINDTGDPPHNYNPQPAQGSSEADWPIEYVLDDYLPGPGHYFYDNYNGAGLYQSFTGNRTFKEQTVEGVYYVNGRIRFQEEVEVGPRGATFVATGQIVWLESEPHVTFRPFDDSNNKGLLAYSTRGDQTCSEPRFHDASIIIREDGASFDGVLYAPRGVASVTGNNSNTVAVWGWFVEIHGDDFATDGPDIDVAGDPKLVFEQ